MVVFHLCTFHLIVARLLPQIQTPLTSVLNKEGAGGMEGAKRSFPLIREEKNVPRVSQIFHYTVLAKLSHMIISRGKVGKIPGQEERSDMKGLEQLKSIGMSILLL